MVSWQLSIYRSTAEIDSALQSVPYVLLVGSISQSQLSDNESQVQHVVLANQSFPEHAYNTDVPCVQGCRK